MGKNIKGWALIYLLLGSFVIMGQGCPQVIYVIGGNGWKARYIDSQGYIITNGVDKVKAQYNLANALLGKAAGYVAYEPTQTSPKPYDCGGCHNTGFTKAGEAPATAYIGSEACITCHTTLNKDIVDGFQEHGHQFMLNTVNNGPPALPFSAVPNPPQRFMWGKTPSKETFQSLPGVRGQWFEDNVGCEACHGPGAEHQANPTGVKLSLDDARKACEKCHVRSTPVDGIEQANGIIEAEAGLVQYREQWEEWNASPHNSPGGPDCTTCHDPHATSIYGDKAKIDGRKVYQNVDCLNCHPGVTIGLGMTNLMCIDCHMPYAAKSATSRSLTGKDNAKVLIGDERVHQWKINAHDAPSPTDYFTADGTAVALDANGKVKGITLNFVCQQCHSKVGIQPHGLPSATPYTYKELQVFHPQVHGT